MNPLRNLNLKGIIKFAFALLTIFFVSCGGDDYTPVIGGDKDNTTNNNGGGGNNTGGGGNDNTGGSNTGGGNEGGGSDNTGGETVGPNTNANVATTDKAVLRLEFPALRKTGKQQVIVYRVNDNTTFDADKVNFSVEWDCDKKSQRWSCYQMHKGYSGTYNRVTNDTGDKYPQDPQVAPADRYEDQYWRSGFDHGHICPNADRTYSYDANYQTFYLTNMQPQYSKFNGSGDNKEYGLWLRMETQLRNWVNNLGPKDTIYVCKGGTIDDEKNIIKRINGKLIVPKYFFTAVLRKFYVNGKYEYLAVGYWCDQTNEYRTDEKIKNHCMSIEKLQQLTGIDFFCNLPDEIEKRVEGSFNASQWKWFDN